MDDPKPMPLASVRTYARDLDRERKKKGLAPEAVLPTPEVAPATTPHVGKIKAVPIPPRPNPPEPQSEMMDLKKDLNDNMVISDAVRQTRNDEVVKAIAETPTTIPSASTLKKGEVTTPRKAVPSNNLRVKIMADESAATIITDTKTDRFHITSSIFSSLKTWWKTILEERRKKKAPKYVVPDSDRRKGIIQMATSQTALGATGGYGKIRDQVRLRDTPPVAEEPATAEAPTTETGWSLVKGPEEPPVQPVVVTPPATIPEPIPEAVPELPLPPVTPEIIVEEEVAPPEPPTSSWSQTLAEELDAQAQQPPIPEVVKVEVSTPPVQPTEPVVTAQSKRRFTLPFNTTAVALSVVIIAVVGFLSVVAVRFFTSTGTFTPIPISGVFLRTPTVTVSTDTTTKSELEATLRSYRDIEPATKEIFFATSSVFHSPASLLSLIDNAIDPNLQQSVTTMVFGWYEKAQPFIILRITDRTSALGGMLKWENTMPNSLETLFAIPNINDATFVDYSIVGTDVRALTGENGQEYLVYGFSNAQTLIITTNRATFVALTTLVTPQ